jgi:hypothetical protein
VREGTDFKPRTERALTEYAVLSMGGDIYAYDPERGVFVTDGEGRLNELLDRKLAKHITSHELSEIVEKVKRRTRDAGFDPPDEMVCLANGVLGH